MSLRHETRAAHEGFTLIEMLIALTVTAVVAGTIAAALVVTFRTVGAANDQVAQSHDAQDLSFWLLPDLQSLGPTPSIDTTHHVQPVPNQCTGGLPSGGPNFVANLTWTDTSTSTTYQADYYTATDSSGQLVLGRYYCASNSTPFQTLTIVHHVSSAVGSVAFCTGPPSCTLPTMTVSTVGPANSPYTFSVSGSGR